MRKDYRIDNFGDTYFIERIEKPNLRMTVTANDTEPEIIRIDLINTPIKVSEFSGQLDEIKGILDEISRRK